MYVENPPKVTEETRWAYDQFLRMLAAMQQQQEEIDRLKELLANSSG